MAPSAAPGGRKEDAYKQDRDADNEHNWEAELSNRYSDDDDDGDAAPATKAKASVPPPAPAAAAAKIAVANANTAAAPTPAEAAAAAADAEYNVDAAGDDEEGERGWSNRMDEFEDEEEEEDGAAKAKDDGSAKKDGGGGGGAGKSTRDHRRDHDDDEYYYDDYDDDELTHALESLDAREDLEARGGGGGGSVGGLSTSTAWRPNANGGTSNHNRNVFRGKKTGDKAGEGGGGGEGKAGGGGGGGKAGGGGGAKGNHGSMQADEDRGRHGAKGGGVGGGDMGQKVGNAFKEAERKLGKESHLCKDKEDRATVEQALDPRTRLILFKMLSHGVFCELNGCISTGKEANVYHAQASDGDNFPGDSENCSQLLADTILPQLRYFAYVQVAEEEQNLWQAYAALQAQFGNFAMRKVDAPSDIYPVFRELFRKEGVEV